MSIDGAHPATPGIAIIGFAGRFPGARSVDEFWKNICNGVESIMFFSPAELQAAGISRELMENPHYVPAKGYLEDWDCFARDFFGYSPNDAELMDPQVRILLECAWESLENAGYVPDCMPGRVGLYVGGSAHVGWLCSSLDKQRTPAGQYHAIALNENHSLSTRISYQLGLRGPSVTLQTACSSSLVAFHMACRSLLGHECDTAIAGGVSLTFPAKAGYLFQHGIVSSPDGHCRAFDERGQGTLAGDGCALVVLKQFNDAVSDGDHVYAVVKGSAINNDGRDKIGYTAPSVSGQMQVIREAQRTGGIDPNTIEYIEAHGTGTVLGDPIEIEALTAAFGSVRRQYCAIGSVKTNIGHLNHAAGIAGLLKASLATHHGIVPPSLHYQSPNPNIAFENTPFYVNTALRSWQPASLRRAGVSSFGIGGTNAHVVLEQAPVLESSPVRFGSWHLLPLSAKSEQSLGEMTTRLSHYLEANPSINIADVAYTLQVGRSEFPVRRAVLCRTRDDAVHALATLPSERVCDGKAVDTPATVAVLLPGEFAWDVRTFAALYRAFAAFRRPVDSCLAALPLRLTCALRTAFGLHDDATAVEHIAISGDISRYAGLFILEYACAGLLADLGIKPTVMLGDRVGKQVAACISGVSDLKHTLTVLARGQAAGHHDDFSKPRGSQREMPVTSDVIGKCVAEDDPQESGYCASALQMASDFGVRLDSLLRGREATLVELGPGSLLSFVRDHAELQSNHQFVSMLPGETVSVGAEAHWLLELGRLWSRGMNVYWSALHAGQQRRRVPLPAYPFERERLPSLLNGKRASSGGLFDAAAKDWCYLQISRRSAAAPTNTRPHNFWGTWLVLADASYLDAMSARLRQGGCPVMQVRSGRRFAESGADEYTIGSSRDDYFDLIEALERRGSLPTHVIHGRNLTFQGSEDVSVSSFQEAQQTGFYSLLFLIQALATRKTSPLTSLNVLTMNGLAAPGDLDVSPLQGPILGLLPVISQEFPGVRCRHADLDRDDIHHHGEAATLGRVIDDLLAAPAEFSASYRAGERWIPQFAALRLPEPSLEQPGLKHNGVYLITGGLGEIGRLIAEYLFRQAEARLILTVPVTVATSTTAENADVKRRRDAFLQRLRDCGAEILVIAADSADRAQMRHAFDVAERCFGRIDGVFHAAAVTRGHSIPCPLVELRQEDCEQQFGAKAHGLLALQELLQDRRLDFVIVMSSLASVLGGLGLGAYAAANRFLDSCSQLGRKTSRTPWIYINWDGWNIPDAGRASVRTHVPLLEPHEALEMLSRIIAAPTAGQILVAKSDLPMRVRQWVDAPDRQVAKLEAATDTSSSPIRTEDKLKLLWQGFFGREDIGVLDNFYDLGGDSLQAVDLLASINAELSLRLQISDLLDAETIFELAKRIDGMRAVECAHPIRRVERREYYPLSFAQEAMLAPRNNVYAGRFNSSCGLALEGYVDPAQLERSFRQLIARQEILRTTFDLQRGVQRVSREGEFSLPLHRCTEQDARSRPTTFIRPFEPEDTPLLRAELLQTSASQWYLLLDMHHAITDALSLNIMMSELWDLYRGADVSRDPVYYKDYSVWQRRWADAGVFRRDEDYWREQIKEHTWTELPTLPARPVAEFGRCVVRADRRMGKSLAHFCERKQITPMSLFMAALSLTATEYTHEPNLTFGLRISRRSELPLQRMLGPFVEDAAYCYRCPKRNQVAELLSTTQATLAAVLDHANHPYEEINRELQERKPTPNGEMFTIMVNHLPPMLAERNTPVRMRFVPLPRPPTSKYHLNIRLQDNDGLKLDAKFRADKYSTEFIERFLGSIIENMIALAETPPGNVRYPNRR